jgi:hypothetical protein
MSMSRTLRRIAALLALAALGFAQLAVSAYACPRDTPGQARSVVEAQPEFCPDRSMPNLCESHCDYGSSTVSTHSNPPPAPDLALLVWGGAVVASEGSLLRTPIRHLARLAAPPSSPRLTPLRI